jgi:hypothetical protein
MSLNVQRSTLISYALLWSTIYRLEFKIIIGLGDKLEL